MSMRLRHISSHLSNL